jgi:hypothetical protein
VSSSSSTVDVSLYFLKPALIHLVSDIWYLFSDYQIKSLSKSSTSVFFCCSHILPVLKCWLVSACSYTPQCTELSDKQHACLALVSLWFLIVPLPAGTYTEYVMTATTHIWQVHTTNYCSTSCTWCNVFTTDKWQQTEHQVCKQIQPILRFGWPCIVV